MVDFLAESGTTQREEAQNELDAGESSEAAAEAELVRLRDEFDPVSDRNTQTLRDLLDDAERGAADLASSITDINRRQSRLTAERRRIEADLDGLSGQNQKFFGGRVGCQAGLSR